MQVWPVLLGIAMLAAESARGACRPACAAGCARAPWPRGGAVGPCPRQLRGGMGDEDEASSSTVDAEWLYSEAVQRNPADVMALGALADVLYDKGDVDGAAVCFDKALALQPSHLGTLFSQGLLLLTRAVPGDLERATELLGRAVDVDPTSVPSLYMYGRLLHTVHGRLPEAEDMYRRALSFEPKRGDILNDYGALLEATGADEDVVRGMYKRAAKLAPTHADALSNYARVMEEVGRSDAEGVDSMHGALALYRRALAARPQHVPTMCNMALTLLSTGEGSSSAEGRDLLQRALALEPMHVGALCQYARLVQEDGNDKEARRLYDKALTLDPSQLDALNGLGTIFEARAHRIWSQSDTGDDKADKECRQLVEKANDMYLRSLKLAPLHADTLSNRGALLMCHFGDDGRAEAEHLFRTALNVKPDHAAALYNFGFMRQLQQRMPEAQELYERAYGEMSRTTPCFGQSQSARWQHL